MVAKFEIVCFLLMDLIFSVGIFEPLPQGHIAQWFSGCYKNMEDACFRDIEDSTAYITRKSERALDMIPMPKLKVLKFIA